MLPSAALVESSFIAWAIIRCLCSSASNLWNQASMSSKGLEKIQELNKSFCVKHHSKFISGNFYMGEVIICTCRRCELSETRQTWKAPRRRRTWGRLAKILRLAFSCFAWKCKSFQLSCVHSFLASTNAAALFSSVQFYQVLVFSCRPNRSWFHLPAEKLMILVTIFPVGNWWLTTWEYLQNSNNPTVQLIIENSSAAPRAKKNGRNLSNDTSFPLFQILFFVSKDTTLLFHHLQLHEILS